MFLNRNSVIFLLTAAFLTFSFSPPVESAQTKTQIKPTPTATKKKTTPTPKKAVKNTPTPKAQVSPKPKTSPKPKVSPKPKTSPTLTAPPVKETPQIIVTAAGARVRSQASTASTELRRVKLGTLIKVLEKSKNDWYRVEIPAGPKKVVGWMSGQVADDWDVAEREEIYGRIVQKNYKPEKMSFLDASELYEFLAKAQNELKSSKLLPEFTLKQLRSLGQALEAIPFDKNDANPYKAFLKANEKSIVYSEPSGEWYVRSEIIWDWQKKYADSPVAEDLAWLGAETPLPGECEGYVNCYLFSLRETDARYLELYPNGKRTAESLKNIQNLLEPIVADLAEKKVYNGPTDVSDRAEFNRLIAEIRTIVSKLFLGEPEKQKTIQQLTRIAEAFR